MWFIVPAALLVFGGIVGGVAFFGFTAGPTSDRQCVVEALPEQRAASSTQGVADGVFLRTSCGKLYLDDDLASALVGELAVGVSSTMRIEERHLGGPELKSVPVTVAP